MSNEEYMTKEMCGMVRDQNKKDHDVTERRLNAHSEELKELTRLVTELTGTNTLLLQNQENLQQNIALLQKNLDASLARLKLVEDEKVNCAAKRIEAQKPASLPTPWYNTPIGQWAIKGGMVILFIVVCAAVGINAIDAMKQVKAVAP